MPNRINDRLRNMRELRLVGDNIEDIRAAAVKLFGTPNDKDIYSGLEAIRIADALELDLVEISANAVPPVCKIIDYQKYLYQQKRREKEKKANSAKVVVKEIRFGPQTDDHDYNFKLKHAQEFLKEGNKVRAYVFFRGRSIQFKEQGEELLLRFANDLLEIGKVDQLPKLEGKRMFLYLSPKKQTPAKSEPKEHKE